MPYPLFLRSFHLDQHYTDTLCCWTAKCCETHTQPFRRTSARTNFSNLARSTFKFIFSWPKLQHHEQHCHGCIELLLINWSWMRTTEIIVIIVVCVVLGGLIVLLGRKKVGFSIDFALVYLILHCSCWKARKTTLWPVKILLKMLSVLMEMIFDTSLQWKANLWFNWNLQNEPSKFRWRNNFL